MNREQERRITVWYCDECGYWRKEESTGVHVAPNPADPRGPYAVHDLREVEYVPALPGTGIRTTE